MKRRAPPIYDPMQPRFQDLVSSPIPVQASFSLHRPTAVWWGIILWLHGKPADPGLSPSECVACVARGFRFYASLYRVLAVILAAAAGGLLLCGALSTLESAIYW